ncbi:MAG: S-adenosylmethionine:tRNA ribosyltransferase-isomerase, partial [Bryobacteraceae bacterium]
LEAEVLGRNPSGERLIRFTGDRVIEEIDRIGHVPLPPYIRRADDAADRARYQTVYARERGSAAAPTAGLHFTEESLASCRKAGAEIAAVTLHVGLGTFQPLRAGNLDDVRVHAEHYAIGPDALASVSAARRRVVVGTTAVRAIETLAATGRPAGETDLFIHPGFEFRLTDAILTNFHLPRSSLLVLVSAFAGVDLTLAAYRHAVEAGYRFYSYGDCMLIV